MYNPYSLKNKVILITGASSGIGKATAIECSKLGAEVIITGRNESRLLDTYNQLEGSGHSIIVADLSCDEGINAITNAIGEKKIDGLVNNAGITRPFPINYITREKMDEIFPINLESPILLFSKLIKHKNLAKGSSTVFTSSINGVCGGGKAESLYCASKAALSGFVKSAALELAPKDIRVNCICPGMTETQILSDETITKEQLVEDAKRYPLKRYAKPVEIAWAIIYLLSEASSFVTGSDLVIDGGVTIIN